MEGDAEPDLGCEAAFQTADDRVHSAAGAIAVHRPAIGQSTAWRYLSGLSPVGMENAPRLVATRRCRVSFRFVFGNAYSNQRSGYSARSAADPLRRESNHDGAGCDKWSEARYGQSADTGKPTRPSAPKIRPPFRHRRPLPRGASFDCRWQNPFVPALSGISTEISFAVKPAPFKPTKRIVRSKSLSPLAQKTSRPHMNRPPLVGAEDSSKCSNKGGGIGMVPPLFADSLPPATVFTFRVAVASPHVRARQMSSVRAIKLLSVASAESILAKAQEELSDVEGGMAFGEPKGERAEHHCLPPARGSRAVNLLIGSTKKGRPRVRCLLTKSIDRRPISESAFLPVSLQASPVERIAQWGRRAIAAGRRSRRTDRRHRKTLRRWRAPLRAFLCMMPASMDFSFGPADGNHGADFQPRSVAGALVAIRGWLRCFVGQGTCLPITVV